MIELIQCTREDPRAWAWLPYVIYRAGVFCESMDTETLPQEAQDLIRLWFVMGDYRLGLWIAVQDQHKLVGHMLATPEPIEIPQHRYVLIRQVQLDKGIDLRDISRNGYIELSKWVKSLGLSKVVMVTHRSSRAMARKWGFVQHKTLMKLSLPTA